jgi:hypothetical protein
MRPGTEVPPVGRVVVLTNVVNGNGS